MLSAKYGKEPCLLYYLKLLTYLAGVYVVLDLLKETVQKSLPVLKSLPVFEYAFNDHFCFLFLFFFYKTESQSGVCQ